MPWPPSHRLTHTYATVLEELLGNQLFAELQPLPEEVRRVQSTSRNKVTLIVFIGGVTFAEISSVRFLSKQLPDQDFVIATTKIINGQTLLEMSYHDVENGLSSDIIKH